MGAKAERPKKRRVKLVGGGYKWTREAQKQAGSMKAKRRALRKAEKAKRGRRRKGG